MRWSLRRDGEVRHGYTALVLPVRRADGTPAVLKLACPDEETAHEALALSVWDGAGVRLLANDEDARALLLGRLDDTRRLDVPAPPQVRTLRALVAAPGA